MTLLKLCHQLTRLGITQSQSTIKSPCLHFHTMKFASVTPARVDCGGWSTAPRLPFSSSAVHLQSTLEEMHRKGKPKKKMRASYTDGQPYLKGVVLKTLIKKPKKPNSANRKCVRVRLSNGKEATAYIPGEGHNLQEHSIVLVRGGKTQDLPGVKLKVVRGKYDLAHVVKKVI